MDYQHLILRSLLSKYEENPPSKTDRGADRRTAVQLGRNSRDLPAYSLAKPTERERFHAIVRDLSNQKLITFSWEPFSHGRVLGTLWLSETPEHLAKSYALIGELPRSEVAAMIRQKIADILADLGHQTVIGSCSDSQTGWIILALQ